MTGKLPWWVKWMLVKVLRWIAKQLREIVEKGFYLRIPVDDKIVYIYIKLEEKPDDSRKVVMLL